MIQLYNYDERDFKGHNGRVLAEVSNDTITWEVNTKYEFQFDYPLFAKHGLAIENEMIVTAPVPGYDDQAFRINSVTKSMGMLTVHAYHVFWDLMQNFVEDTNIVDKNGSGALSQLMTKTQFPNQFTYTSTVANTATARIVRMSVIAALIGTDENTVLSRWGGEFEWDNFHFNHVAQLGADRGVIFRNRKNLLGYEATEDLTDTVTRIMPEGYDGLLLPELYVDSPLIGNYTSPRVAKIEYSDIKAIDEESVTADEDALPLDEALDALRTKAREEYIKNHVDEPTHTYELNVVMLEDTEEYKDRGIFSCVYPGDTATFIHDEDGLNVKARMTGYTWSPATQQYLTLTFKSNQRNTPDIEHKLDSVVDRISLIDRTALAKAANHSNTVGWSADGPAAIEGNKEGDVWYQQVGIHVIMWIYHNGEWQEGVSDIAGHDATNITEGTINAANVNIINLNANNIVTGTISGPNLAINLITGQVVFQSGNIRSADGNFDIDIDDGTVTSASKFGGTMTLDSASLRYRSKFDNALKGEVAFNWGNLFYGEALVIRGNNMILLGIQDPIAEDKFTANGNPFVRISKSDGLILAGGSTDNSRYSILQLSPDSFYVSSYQDPNGMYGSGNVVLTSYNSNGGLASALNLESSGGVSLTGGTIQLSGTTSVWGDFSVTGTKNAVHITRDGIRATPAYETAESYLGDIGENKTDASKQVKVPIEELFSDTIRADLPYQVFLQSYSAAHVWVSSRNEDSFTVESDQPNAPFAWELKAKRRGHENERLVKQEIDPTEYAEKIDGYQDTGKEGPTK
ncbi:phage tail spike protein [Levilactobacillus namurensis]|uniref:phage tail spike protein n=1 Tax=Levilactobacillus namurensis TaxID=380393 RepID=UPI00222FA78E|nr:phage tail spike protein [Levilactobacillus namurensis]MCW3778515.1 phage tail protein [Levilactobacillus namurensis]MDT7019564.1 phage tail spike protein [Levilactobacillus namurensis]WNN65848.1 phage tail spike protein [Levilactobacillus namurensis]